MSSGLVMVWVSLGMLGEPHIDHDNGSRTQNNGIYVSIYLSMYHLITPRLSHPGCRDQCMPWNGLCTHVFRYIDVLMCVIYNCTRLNSKDNWSITCCFSHEDYQRRQVNVQTHGISRFSLYRDNKAVAGWQLACTNQKRPMGNNTCS